MCGFVGLLGREGAVGTADMCAHIRHRGPDRADSVPIPHGSLSACRLALRGDSAEPQPLSSADGRWTLAFNGEIYNVAALARRWAPHLSAQPGTSDTFVLLESARQGGGGVLREAEGMFAAILAGPGAILLARDAFGIKPLYYRHSPDRAQLYFASEIKALFAAPEVPRQICARALAEQLAIGCPLGGRTLFSSIEQVAPGQLLEARLVRRGEINLSETDRLSRFGEHGDPCGDADLERELAASVTACAEASNEEVALLLSGGIDSALVAALHPDPVGKSAITFTDGSDALGEVDTARLVARHFGFRHDVIRLDPGRVWQDALASICAHEQPLAYSAIHAAGREIGHRTVMTADGADELFRGYRIHRDPFPFVMRAGRRVRALASAFPAARGLLAELFRLLEELSRSYGSIDDFLLTQLLVQKHLKIWDKGAMARSIEVRLPFLSPAVARVARREAASEFGGASSKMALRRVLARRLPWSLNARLLRRPKTAITASTGAVRRHMIAEAKRIMPSEHAARHPFRLIAENPLDLLSLDLFLYAFLGHGGLMAGAHDPQALYTDDLDVLHDMLAQVALQLQEPKPGRGS